MYLKPEGDEYCQQHCKYFGKIYCDIDDQDFNEVCNNCPIDDFIEFCEGNDI